MLPRGCKRFAERACRALLEGAQRCGWDLLPRRAYSQIPALAKLRQEVGWRAPRYLEDVPGHGLAGQLRFAREVLTSLTPAERARPLLHEAARDAVGHDGFGPVEAAVLAAFVRTRRPRRILQVGAGLSTAVMLEAAREVGHRLEVVALELKPDAWLCERGRRGEIELRAGGAQEHLAREAGALADGDLLFVDSSHRVTVGSEVNQIVLDLLPRLAPGSWAHFHDVNWPYDYGREILGRDLWFHQEGALLLAYLNGHARWRVRLSLSQLHYAARRELGLLLPLYRPAADRDGSRAGPGHFPSSLYLEASR